MPYEINWEKNGVLVKFWGLFDFETNASANTDMYNDPRSNDLKYIIWDTSRISELSVKEGETRIIAAQDEIGSSRLSKIKMALFAQDKATRKICEQYCSHYQSRQTGWDFMVSDNMESIRNWVNS